uniref:Conodipine_Vc3 prepropeptide n=1 Tax=Conus victoriae TaxID=319920 RepID=W4VS19_CONVC
MFVLGLSMMLAVAGRVVMGVDPCAQYANGCSVPLHMPLFYKTLFTPSCNRHDVCYRCGAKYGISKDTCDSAFLHHMEAACAVHDASRRHISLQSSSSSSASHLQKRSACTVFAKDVFYEAVHIFGGLFYHDVDGTASFCSEPTAVSCLHD